MGDFAKVPVHLGSLNSRCNYGEREEGDNLYSREARPHRHRASGLTMRRNLVHLLITAGEGEGKGRSNANANKATLSGRAREERGRGEGPVRRSPGPSWACRCCRSCPAPAHEHPQFVPPRRAPCPSGLPSHRGPHICGREEEMSAGGPESKEREARGRVGERLTRRWSPCPQGCDPWFRG
jgi:hypothetical protein